MRRNCCVCHFCPSIQLSTWNWNKDLIFFFLLFFIYRKPKIAELHVMRYFSKKMNEPFYDIGSDLGLLFAVPAVYLRWVVYKNKMLNRKYAVSCLYALKPIFILQCHFNVIFYCMEIYGMNMKIRKVFTMKCWKICTKIAFFVFTKKKTTFPDKHTVYPRKMFFFSIKMLPIFQKCYFSRHFMVNFFSSHISVMINFSPYFCCESLKRMNSKNCH